MARPCHPKTFWKYQPFFQRFSLWSNLHLPSKCDQKRRSNVKYRRVQFGVVYSESSRSYIRNETLVKWCDFLKALSRTILSRPGGENSNEPYSTYLKFRARFCSTSELLCIVLTAQHSLRKTNGVFECFDFFTIVQLERGPFFERVGSCSENRDGRYFVFWWYLV